MRVGEGVATQGLRLEVNLEVPPEVFEQLRRNGIQISLAPQIVAPHPERDFGWRLQSGLNLAKIKGDADTLTLLHVSTSEDTGHAIAILDFDVARRVVTYSDPNYPNQAVQRSFTAVGDTFRVDGFGRFGLVKDVLRIRTQNFDRAPSQRWADLAGKRAWIVHTDGRRHLTTIDSVDAPSHEYPGGRIVEYSHLFGSGGGGTSTFDDVADIEAVAPPSKAELAKYQKLVGKEVRLEFVTRYWNQEYGGDTYRVEGVSREVDRIMHPFGGLELISTTKSFAQSHIVPFDAIASISAR